MTVRLRRRALLGALGSLAVAGCGSMSSSKAEFVAPRAALIDEELPIELRGLPGARRVTVTAETTVSRDSYSSTTWSSSATFVSTSDGTVSLHEAPPTTGDYEGADPMGLFWTMTPESGEDAFFPARRHDVTLTATVDDRTVAETTIDRRLAVAGVSDESLDGDLVGTVFTPPGSGSAPGVVLLHGSRAGELGPAARLLASHGFVALALQYFGGPDPLPDVLSEVPVEYVQRAIDVLLAHPRVNGPQVGLWGVSKGGELALLVGSRDDHVGAVVGLSPSSLVWEGFDSGGYPTGTSSWAIDGQPVPYLAYADYEAVPDSADPFDRPRSFYEYSQLQARPTAVANATIPVERIDGDVLLFSGTDDRLWHSTPMSNRAIDRLDAHDHPYRSDHLAFEGAGHVFRLPILPTDGTSDAGRYPLGGAPGPNARASRKHWPKALDLLAGVGGERFAPESPSVDPEADPGNGETGSDTGALGYAGVFGAVLVTGLATIGIRRWRDRAREADRRDGIDQFVRSPSGHLAVAAMLAAGGFAAVLLWDPGIALLLLVLAFVVLVDRVSLSVWDRLEAYFEENEPAADATPDRELTPPSVSRTTKIVVLIGTGTSLLYLLIGAAVSLLLL